jgi:hypothetical protein
MSLGPSDRLFALRRVSAFAAVATADLAVIATRMTERAFQPGELVAGAGRLPERLLVVVDGDTRTAEGARLAPLIGLPALLVGKPPGQDVLAGPAGARTLALGRDHLFAAIQACPEILAAVLEELDREAFE